MFVDLGASERLDYEMKKCSAWAGRGNNIFKKTKHFFFNCGGGGGEGVYVGSRCGVWGSVGEGGCGCRGVGRVCGEGVWVCSHDGPTHPSRDIVCQRILGNSCAHCNIDYRLLEMTGLIAILTDFRLALYAKGHKEFHSNWQLCLRPDFSHSD